MLVAVLWQYSRYTTVYAAFIIVPSFKSETNSLKIAESVEKNTVKHTSRSVQADHRQHSLAVADLEEANGVEDQHKRSRQDHAI